MKCFTRTLSKVPRNGELLCTICEEWHSCQNFRVKKWNSYQKDPAGYNATCKRCENLKNAVRKLGHTNCSKKEIQEYLKGAPISTLSLVQPNHPKRKPRKPKPEWTQAQKEWYAEEAERKEEEPGWVYLIGEGDEHHAWKIGFSTEPECRLGDLQPGNPRKLKVVRKFEGSEEDEAALHRQFMKHNLLGEWFRCDPAIENEFVRRGK